MKYVAPKLTLPPITAVPPAGQRSPVSSIPAPLFQIEPSPAAQQRAKPGQPMPTPKQLKSMVAGYNHKDDKGVT